MTISEQDGVTELLIQIMIQMISVKMYLTNYHCNALRHMLEEDYCITNDNIRDYLDVTHKLLHRFSQISYHQKINNTGESLCH